MFRKLNHKLTSLLVKSGENLTIIGIFQTELNFCPKFRNKCNEYIVQENYVMFRVLRVHRARALNLTLSA